MKYLIILLLFALCGCTTVTVKTADCEATYTSIFKSIDGAGFKICGGSAELTNSNSNTEILRIVEGLANK